MLRFDVSQRYHKLKRLICVQVFPVRGVAWDEKIGKRPFWTPILPFFRGGGELTMRRKNSDPFLKKMTADPDLSF